MPNQQEIEALAVEVASKCTKPHDSIPYFTRNENGTTIVANQEIDGWILAILTEDSAELNAYGNEIHEATTWYYVLTSNGSLMNYETHFWTLFRDDLSRIDGSELSGLPSGKEVNFSMKGYADWNTPNFPSVYALDYECDQYEIEGSGGSNMRRIRTYPLSKTIGEKMGPNVILPQGEGIKKRLLQLLENSEIDYSKEYINRLYDKAKRIYTAPAGSQKSSSKPAKSGGCYIATAVYGSYDCPEVWVLRRFRDEKLSRIIFGRAFISLYYALSPALVKHFGQDEWFSRFWKGKLDRLVARLEAKGF